VGIAAFALSRLLKGKANPKTVETIETGWTIIDKATHGDPKSASVSILQADKITLRKVRDNIPDIESLFNKINQEEDAFSRQISLNDPIIARLENYVEGHRDADPNGMTEDPQLYHAGYETNGEVASGYHNLIEKNLQLRDHLNGLGEYSNYLRTNIASAEERIIADDSSESSDERFVGGKEG
jgi:hypothetical protein